MGSISVQLMGSISGRGLGHLFYNGNIESRIKKVCLRNSRARQQQHADKQYTLRYTHVGPRPLALSQQPKCGDEPRKHCSAKHASSG